MGKAPSNDELVPELTLDDINRAFDDNEFCFYLQPKCNAVTGAIVGAEAFGSLEPPQVWRDFPGTFRSRIGAGRPDLPAGHVRMAFRGPDAGTLGT